MVARENAGDYVGVSVEHQLPADRLRIPAEAPLPESVREHNRVGFAGLNTASDRKRKSRDSNTN